MSSFQPSQTTLGGDSHNFGRRVEVSARHVHKPRTIAWERLLLSRGSPLRVLLREHAARDGLAIAAFEFLGDLGFRPSRSGHGGEVDRIDLQALPRMTAAKRRELAVVVGRSLALFSWLGISDLHWENLALGVGRDGAIQLTPLDVEIILSDLALPTETQLLPEAEPDDGAVYQHACGLRRVLPFLGKPVRPNDVLTIVASYRETLGFLERNGRAIAAVFDALPGLRDTPIRVCLRGTGDYVLARSQSVWPPLLDAEREQLERGDIPYFFRLYGRPGIHFYADSSLEQVATLPRTGDVPRLPPLLSTSRGLRAPSRARLRDQGTLTLLGAFDHPDFAGTHASDGITVTFDDREIVAQVEDGELACPRDLRAIVSSVYMPCGCGEVRTVLVPARTICSSK